MSVVVVGGSQGAKILADVVPAAIALLPEDLRRHLRVAQQARPEDLERVTAAYDAADIPAEVDGFFADVPRRFAEAQLVISRAGASTVADLTVIGRPSILVPLAAAIRDEQTANARGLVTGGAAILMPESAFTPQALAEQLRLILTNPDGATHMATAATALGLPNAAHSLADLAERLAKR
jgi:UDP-N-acetylglucosamine--N-acetylmuramyl-(pentapeptide) pyrophosphoryl-undecaprenol N-acetylglucosamine transferase